MNADLKLRVENLASEMKDMESLKNAELERCRNENDELQDLQRVAAENLATSQKVLTEYLTIKRRCRNHITSSFSKMVSPSNLILTEHVTISLLPIKFWLLSSSTLSFLIKATNDDFSLKNKPTKVLLFQH